MQCSENVRPGERMKLSSIGFIGGGRVTSIILEGWRAAGKLPEQIVVSDTAPEVLNRLKARFPGVETTVDNRHPANQDFVFIALHPPKVRSELPLVRDALKPEALVISLAPVLRSSALVRLLGGFERLARVIPNAPSAIGKGFNPTAFAPQLGRPERDAVSRLLDPLGVHPEVDEERLEAYAILTGMGPTYYWFQWQALRELGRDFGLTPSEVDQSLRQMIHGAADLLLASGRPPDEVMGMVPLRPLSEIEAQVLAAYYEKLSSLHGKLKAASCEYLRVGSDLTGKER
ncbi:MAG: NAD(P)-binding domain-containing protein [candidate division WOR-3 bacterium]